jgi:alpha-ribazole phosphatase
MAGRLVLIRHGDTGEANRGRYIGRTDLPLSAEGERQAADLARVVGRWPEAPVLCSPLQRCRRTAEIALGPDRDLEIDTDLREVDFGLWEGLSFAEIAKGYPAAVESWATLSDDFRFPGGEALAAFGNRVAAAARRIAADPAETILAVTHGGVIRLLLCHFLGIEVRCYLLFDVGIASLSEIRIEAGHGVLTLLNSRCHLAGWGKGADVTGETTLREKRPEEKSGG